MNKAGLFAAVVLLQWSNLVLAVAPPMTFKEIAMLLRNGEQQSFIQDEVSRRKLAQPITAQEEVSLTAMGATPALLSTLRAGAAVGSTTGTPTPPPTSIPAASANPSSTPGSVPRSLLSERHSHTTQLLTTLKTNVPLPEVPANGRFQLVSYRSPVGELPALITTLPRDGTLHPGIVWIVGGWSNSISSVPWDPAPPTNDQSASAFSLAGVVTLYPSLRGGNHNPGSVENFYGEVDDVIAAADFLARQPGVDPNRIYLGGHSTGGTLALLTAESSDRFRGVFALGPVSSPIHHSKQATINFDLNNPKEVELRSPIKWLDCIHTPTFVLEGTVDGNIRDLNEMQSKSTNPMVHFYPVVGGTHFTEVAPLTHLIAKKILEDTGSVSTISFSTGPLTMP